VNKLWVRLTVGFGLVTITAIVVAALLANYRVSTEFRRFVGHSQMVARLEPELVRYYAGHGSWAGVETIFDDLPRSGGQGPGLGRQRGGPQFILTDMTGRVVFSGEEGAPTQLASDQLTDAVPLEWQGQPVGYLAANPPGPAELTGAAQNFLSQINRALLQAGLIAGSLGILLGVIIAWGVSAPLGRLATAARQISQGQLEQRVPLKGTDEIAALAEAFNDMASELQHAEKLRRNLVADVAHELRTPLSVVQGNLRAILDGVFPLNEEEVASIYDETLTLNRLVNDLRELSQAEARQVSLNLQPSELSDIVTNTSDRVRELSREKEIEVTVTLPADLPLVLIDPDRTRQILQNLLSNALRHTPAGGKIAVMVQEQTVASDRNLANFISIAVRDTGPGIAPEDLPYVFDRFWRADNSRSREYGGTGLGLAIAKQLVEAQGGKIGVENEGIPGRGSCFWFTVPAATT
jgi:two-component system OmpR family sensor kinase/two-component system sensor histidine kinase BaeS